MNDPLLTRYRPETWDEVIGHDSVVKSMRGAIERGTARTFLLTGPSGVGKTTLARVASTAAGCDPFNSIEIDAATHTGVDEVRSIQDLLKYHQFGGSKNRAVIVDECHRLSAQARDSLLKIVEEPPEGIYWFFCTTEPGKVPPTLKTRCAAYTLKPVARDDLCNLLDTVLEEEGWQMEDDIADLCIEEAHGSPRQLLANMAVCQDAAGKKEAANLLRSAVGSEPVNKLCQCLLNSGSWGEAMGLVAKLDEPSTESVRIIVCNYMAAVLRNTKDQKRAVPVLRVLEAFSRDAPWNPSEKAAPLILAIGRACFGD